MDQNGEVRARFSRGVIFLGHPNTPRPISKDAGTVPAHFDQGFIGQLSKLTFRPTVDVQLGYVRKISKIVLDYATRALDQVRVDLPGTQYSSTRVLEYLQY